MSLRSSLLKRVPPIKVTNHNMRVDVNHKWLEEAQRLQSLRHFGHKIMSCSIAQERLNDLLVLHVHTRSAQIL